jgi:hypothetical protein
LGLENPRDDHLPFSEAEYRRVLLEKAADESYLSSIELQGPSLWFDSSLDGGRKGLFKMESVKSIIDIRSLGDPDCNLR